MADISKVKLRNGGTEYNIKDHYVRDIIATEFSSSTNYLVGDYCIYNGFFYICTVAHRGAWNANHFELTTVGERLKVNGRPSQTITADKTEVILTPSKRTDTITITGAQTALKAQSSDTSIATASISGNTVIVTAVSNGEVTISIYAEASTTYEQSNQIDVSTNVTLNKIYGVTWDGSSSSAWTRTDDAALFTDPVPAVNNGNGSSPFDNIAPWKDMVVVERTGGTMVTIPKFYFKLTKSGSAMSLKIMDGSSPDYALANGYQISPAHMDRGDGNGERDVIYVGKYQCASDFKSKTGVAPKANTTRADFRSGIHALGSTIWQWDYATLLTIQMLYLVEYADWNSQTKIGYGCSASGSIQNIGLTDGMTYHTGTNAASRTTYGQIKYRNIEGLWSNILTWVDGIYSQGQDIYAIKNPNSFSDTTNGTKVQTMANAMSTYRTPVTAEDVSSASGFEWFMFPADGGGSTSTYITDNFDAASMTNAGDFGAFFNGAAARQALDYGLFYGGLYLISGAYAFMSSRIMELP